MHDLEALARVVQKRAETAMRKAIAALPDGRYEHRVEADGLDTHLSFPIRIAIEGDEIEVGFEGSPPQMDQGGSNCTLTYTRAHATYPLKCILSPEVPGNAGCYRPMKVTAPEKSIMNCDRPLAVNMRTRTGWYIAPNVFGALAQAASGRVQAFTGLPSSALFYGIGPDGIFYSDHLFQGGGQGASERGDGHSALLYPTSAGNTGGALREPGPRDRHREGVPRRQRRAGAAAGRTRTGDLGPQARQRRQAVPGRTLSHGRAEAGAGALRRPAGWALGRHRRPVRRCGPGRGGGRSLGAGDGGGVRRAPGRRRVRIRRSAGTLLRRGAARPRRGLHHGGGRGARLRLRGGGGRRRRPCRERTPASRARGLRLRGPRRTRGPSRRIEAAEAARIQRPASARPPSARAAR